MKSYLNPKNWHPATKIAAAVAVLSVGVLGGLTSGNVVGRCPHGANTANACPTPTIPPPPTNPNPTPPPPSAGVNLAHIWVSQNGSDSGSHCTLSGSLIANPDPGGTTDCKTLQKAYNLTGGANICGKTIGVTSAGGLFSAQTIGGTGCSSGPATTIANQTGQSIHLSGIQLGVSCCTGVAPSWLTMTGMNIDDGYFTCGGVATAPTNIIYSNAKIWSAHSRPTISDNLMNVCANNMTISNAEIGPCTVCNGDAIWHPAPGGQPTTGFVLDHSYLHDVYDSCDHDPPALLAQYGCNGLAFGDVAKTLATLAANITTTPAKGTVETITVSSPKANMPSTATFMIQIDSEYMWVTSTSGNTWTVKRAADNAVIQSNCYGSSSGVTATHTAGALIRGCNSGLDHDDAWHSQGCLNCVFSYNRIAAINPSSGSGSWNTAAQGYFGETALCSAAVCYSNLTFKGNMVACGCGNNPFSLGSDRGGIINGTLKFLYNSVQGGMLLDSSLPAPWQPGTQIIYAGNVVKGFIHDNPSNACTFADSSGGTITIQSFANLWPTQSCGATDKQGSPTWQSTDWYTPDFHLTGIQTATANGDSAYCGPGKEVDTDIDGVARPTTGCSIGAYQQQSIQTGASLATCSNPNPCGNATGPVTFGVLSGWTNNISLGSVSNDQASGPVTSDVRSIAAWRPNGLTTSGTNLAPAIVEMGGNTSSCPFGGHAGDDAYRFAQFAPAHKFVLIDPQCDLNAESSGAGCSTGRCFGQSWYKKWSSCAQVPHTQCAGANDIPMLDAVYDYITSCPASPTAAQCIDPKRVWALGDSTAGAMAVDVLCSAETSHEYRGVLSVSNGLQVGTSQSNTVNCPFPATDRASFIMNDNGHWDNGTPSSFWSNSPTATFGDVASVSGQWSYASWGFANFWKSVWGCTPTIAVDPTYLTMHHRADASGPCTSGVAAGSNAATGWNLDHAGHGSFCHDSDPLANPGTRCAFPATGVRGGTTCSATAVGNGATDPNNTCPNTNGWFGAQQFVNFIEQAAWTGP